MEERLQKYMARCGVASRRKCEEYITSGRVKVNGTTVTELGAKIIPEKDKVFVDSKIIYPEENKLYIALNKPVGYVSTVKDEHDRKTIIDLVNVKERIYPIGRLDYDSSGLILLTNDGNIYNSVIHPRKSIDKVYIAVIEGIPSKGEVLRFCSGIDIGDYITAPADMDILEKFTNSCRVKIKIHEGKNRQIRRMCEALGHPVVSLQRVSVGSIELKDLPLGRWRHLTKDEVDYLRGL